MFVRKLPYCQPATGVGAEGAVGGQALHRVDLGQSGSSSLSPSTCPSSCVRLMDQCRVSETVIIGAAGTAPIVQ